MVDRIEDTIRRYYGLIITVIGIMFAIFGAVYAVTQPIQSGISDVKADVRELRAGQASNLERQNESAKRLEREDERMWEVIRRIESQMRDSQKIP